VSEADAAVGALEAALEYRFQDPGLALTALTHPSYSQPLEGSRGNERLEFLGDAVLDLAVSHVFFDAYPDWDEGDLTRARAALVNGRALAARARALGLGTLLRLGTTEQRSGGERKESILANGFEAVLGAVYLDGGLEPVFRIVGRLFGDQLTQGTAPRDPKTAFQEWAHATVQQTPSYETVADSEIENDERRFTVELILQGESWGRGVGRTKRAAERAAADAALSRIPDEADR
jgi:ribonuclease-3